MTGEAITESFEKTLKIKDQSQPAPHFSTPSPEPPGRGTPGLSSLPMAGLGGDFFLADDMYILFIFLLVITHTLSFFLGYIIAGGDFGSRYLQALQAYYRLTWSHRDVAWD